MTDPQQPGGQQDLNHYTQGGRYTSPEEAMQQELIAQGYDPNSPGFFSALRNAIAQAQAQAAETKDRTQQTQQLSQGVDFRSGLQPSNADYLGYDHPALKSMVQSVNPGQVTGVSTAWTNLANAMATFGQQLGQAATKSGATWKGDAAESAYSFVSGLSTWSDQSGQAAQLAADQIYNQSSAAETAKNSMPDPIPFSWTAEIKSWVTSNPFDLTDNIDKSFQKQQQSQQAHDQAAQVMSAYDNNLYAAASKAPAFNPPPTFDGPTTSSAAQISGTIGGTHSSAYTGPTGGGGASGGNGGYSGNSGLLSGSLAGYTTPPLSTGAKTGSGSSAPGKTSAQGYPSPNNYNASNSSAFNATGLGAMGGMPMGAMGGGFGAGNGEEYSSKLGRGGAGGGFGPGGGSTTGGRAGAGAQSGARAGGAGAAETAAGAAGARGATGTSSRSGTSGMGHGGKGEGSEDEEHQRPSWLVEADPDDIFGTNERTAPPVIGE